MRQIEIDDEVFAFLQGQARAFVDTPNLTLRRLLPIDKPTVTAASKPLATDEKAPPRKTRRKQPKANLRTLVSSGRLADGQALFLVDYQDNTLSQHRAVVSGASLKWRGQLYSMSDLARELLQKEGYSSNSVRGPAHWCTEQGVTIKTLWQQYLNNS